MIDKQTDNLHVGVRIAGRVTKEEVSKEIYDFCNSPLVDICYILIGEDATEEYIIKWTEDFKNTNTAFIILPIDNFELSKELAVKIKATAGELFLGSFAPDCCETGSRSCTPNYCKDAYRDKQNYKNLEAAFKDYIDIMKQKADKTREITGLKVPVIEATAYVKYAYAAGVDIVISEIMPADPEKMLAFSRGAKKGYNKKEWGTLLAHEWYGGFDNSDELKYKRLKLLYDYTYMAGSNYIFIESGEFNIKSYGQYYDKNSKFCKRYKSIREDFVKASKKEVRGNKDPLIKVAFIYGNLDPYTGFGTSSYLYQYDNPEFKVSEAEKSWDILDDVKKSAKWCDTTDFGEYSLSNAPAYGDYDIIPIESDVSTLKKYDYLIFLGWNTMTVEIYEKLKEYVKDGGNLLLSAAHLNTSTKHNGEFALLNDGKLSEFFGCDLGDIIEKDSAVKFFDNTSMKGLKYPAPKKHGINNSGSDSLYPNGPVRLVKTVLKGGKVLGISNDTHRVFEDDTPMLIENKYGKGIVSLTTNADYPGNMGVKDFYSCIVRAFFAASHRMADIHIVASDKVRFNVYEWEKGKKIFLLNTDFTLNQNVIIINDEKKQQLTLEPLERTSVVIKDSAD